MDSATGPVLPLIFSRTPFPIGSSTTCAKRAIPGVGSPAASGLSSVLVGNQGADADARSGAPPLVGLTGGVSGGDPGRCFT